MENGNKEKAPKNKKLSFQAKIILFELLMIIILTALGFYFRGRIRSANTYINEHNTLVREKARCEELLAQQSGDFDTYQYCRQILQVFSE